MKREYTGNEVAIIGISCKFPQSPDWQSFWRNLLAGQELVSFFSREELLAAGANPETIDQPNYVPAKAVLEDTECFDYGFFGYSHREASKMDPQLRVLHEVSYNAFLDAGMTPGESLKNAGVFIGSTLNLTRLGQFSGVSQDISEMFDVSNYNDPASFAAQIAYRMKLNGPAVHVQTACSTSLSAVHLACKALLAGECEMALAGGACITDPVAGGYLHQDGMILSPDGHCKTFADDGQGTVNGNGVAVVLLKLLEEALADGDPIHAVIVESGMNNDGDRKVSFEAPSVQGQAEVISQVYQLADIPFSSLGMIEAHGTATVLGDPIEIQALNKAAQELLTPEALNQFRCAVGSVKSNMGHLDAAAGIAGLIKAALSVRFGKIPPSLHFNQPNPHLNLDKTPFWVPTQATDWPQQQEIRRAGVSSFGIGGTNVHVLLEQPPKAVHEEKNTAERAEGSEPLQILPLSAKSPLALATLVKGYSNHLDVTNTNQDGLETPNLSAIACQLQENRLAYESRAAFVAQNSDEWKQQLDHWSLMDGAGEIMAGQAWLFSGQGSQSQGMGLRLAAEYPEFGEIYLGLLDKAAALLSVDKDTVIEWIKQPPEKLSTYHLQPILYALQVALGIWLQKLGCQPAALCGFSMGELTVATIAGVFTPEEGMELMVARAQLMEAMPKGAAFAASYRPTKNSAMKKAFDGKFPDKLWCISELSPNTWALATERELAVDAENWLTQNGFTFKRVPVSHAFHTPMIEPAAKAFGDLLKNYHLKPAKCTVYSTTLGRKLAAEEMSDPQYWIKQILTPVQFGAALKNMAQDNPDALFVQIGTGADLLQHTRKWLHVSGERVTSTLGAEGADQEVSSVLQFIAKTWTHGGNIEWSRLHNFRQSDNSPQPRHKLHLPGHAFERVVCLPPERTTQANAPALPELSSLFFGSHYYGFEWEKVSVAAPENSVKRDAIPATWIICQQVTERERTLAGALGLNGDTLRFIEMDAYIERMKESGGDFANSYTELPAWLVQQGLQTSEAMDVIITGLLDDLNTQQAQFWAFWLPTALARWSAEQNLVPDMRLFFPATQMAAWNGTETLNAEKNQLQGPLLILPEEYPNIATLCVDLASPDAECAARGLQPWREQGWQGGQFYCFRQKNADNHSDGNNGSGNNNAGEEGFWRRRITSRVQKQPVAQTLPNISRNSWVLITGANGGMGSAIAEYLARVYHCNLLLLMRQPLPKRREWLTEIENGSSHAALLQWAQDLEAKGSRVEFLHADLGLSDSLEKAFQPVFQLAKRGVGIDYLFHTAGRGEGAMLQMRSEAESLATLAPKVTGTRFFCDNLKRLGNPALLLFSSLGNLLPKEKIGQIAYVAGNACLEAYAEQVRSNGGKAQAIAWDDWAESGMATRSAQQLDQALKHPQKHDATEAVVWRYPLHAKNDWWLDEHRLDESTTVMPAMGMVALAHRAAGELRGDAMSAFSLQGITIEKPLIVADEKMAVDDQIVVNDPIAENDDIGLDAAVVFAAGLSEFEIFSGRGEFSRETWNKHASGKITPCDNQTLPTVKPLPESSLQNLFRAADNIGVSPKAALTFGPRWHNVISVDQVISAAQTASHEILNQLQLPFAYQGEAETNGLHVALLDTATLIASPENDDVQFAPVSIGGFTQFAPMCDHVKSHVQIQDIGTNKLLQVNIYSQTDTLLVTINDLLLVDASAVLLEQASTEQTSTEQIPTEQTASMHHVMRLQHSETGNADFSFVTQLEARKIPGPLDVEIQVKAAGINFKDVLIALGVLPAPIDPTMTFGQEAAGIVTRVGRDVTGIQVGDRVMCAGHSCLAEHVVMPQHVVAHIPSILGFQQAAGIPVAFTTAWIALKHTANLKAGQRILIHSAAGGVGMAAMQMALYLGAEVWVTAGSEEKRRLLMGMGAKGAANSRTREFGDVFRRELGERPFDVILNALAGELLEESVSLLAPQGRFLELGLRDILQNWQLGLSIFAEGGSFHAVQAGAEHPAYQEAWSEVTDLLAQEVLKPLPTKIYPANEISGAFQYMAQGKHIGKIAIAMDERNQERSFVEKLRAEGLSNAEGTQIALAMAALVRQTSLSYVAVSKLPIGSVLEKQRHTQQMLFSSDSTLNAPNVTHDGVQQSLKGANAEELLKSLRIMLEGFLGIDGVDVDASFFSLGATSLDLIQFAKRLEQRLERDIPVTLLFKAASLRELSKELASPQFADKPATEDESPMPQPGLGDKRRSLQARRKLRDSASE
ncbi:putative polyketide synthase [Xenorhabdus mauleonii]|uniref:Acyl transferase domain-containing protein n=1 Tax=Xenorhabdus mauleonii TaxID=351675 RepID=A0A1I3JHP1_9GAMM|nr:type I polyketide synthase [Xenorhabdus mauleonii]PHM46206.1 putative polyketide synthase [Xenorhabdus mauleonii]SFI59435.1 Acyl transferase domain-containing protein [Xenorhabdus mauleonii]